MNTLSRPRIRLAPFAPEVLCDDESSSRIGVGIFTESKAPAIREDRSLDFAFVNFTRFMSSRSGSCPCPNFPVVSSFKCQGVTSTDVIDFAPRNIEVSERVLDLHAIRRKNAAGTSEDFETTEGNHGCPENCGNAHAVVMECGKTDTPASKDHYAEDNWSRKRTEYNGFHRSAIVASKCKLNELTGRATW